MAGNLIPVTKSGDQLHVNFKAFRENRLPCTLKIRDPDQEPAARVAFMKEPKVARGEAPQTPICNLNIRLPDTISVGHDGGPSLRLIFAFCHTSAKFLKLHIFIILCSDIIFDPFSSISDITFHI